MSVANGVNIEIQEAAGGVTAAAGFVAGGLHAGLKKCPDKKDLAIIHSLAPAVVGAVFTQNKFAAAPVNWCRQVVAGGRAQAVVVNSGNANACTGAEGAANAAEMAAVCGKALQAPPEQVLVCSTGVIGVQLPMPLLREGIATCAAQLSTQGGQAAAEAIMTTDLYCKETAVSYQYQGKTVTVGGIAKGSGMIHPNMATMLGFLTTDAAISAELLQKALKLAADDTFNMVSVDGDTSTNDMVAVLANGMAGNAPITEEGPEFGQFLSVVREICTSMAKKIAGDGEGATKLVECTVTGAPSLPLAKAVAKSVITSSLTKAAMFGADANWGRILCAIGYTEGDFTVDTIRVDISSAKGSILVCENGAGVAFDEGKAKEILLQEEIHIEIGMGQGDAQATAWGCDLTYDYVKINGDYRT